MDRVPSTEYGVPSTENCMLNGYWDTALHPRPVLSTGYSVLGTHIPAASSNSMNIGSCPRTVSVSEYVPIHIRGGE